MLQKPNLKVSNAFKELMTKVVNNPYNEKFEKLLS